MKKITMYSLLVVLLACGVYACTKSNNPVKETQTPNAAAVADEEDVTLVELQEMSEEDQKTVYSGLTASNRFQIWKDRMDLLITNLSPSTPNYNAKVAALSNLKSKLNIGIFTSGMTTTDENNINTWISTNVPGLFSLNSARHIITTFGYDPIDNPPPPGTNPTTCNCVTSGGTGSNSWCQSACNPSCTSFNPKGCGEWKELPCDGKCF